MVGKNNKRLLREKHANKFKRYALKKLTVGLASVTIGTGLAFATSSTVSADELAVGESTAVVSDKTAKEQSQPDTPYLQEQEEAVPPAEEPQVTEDRISEEKAVKTSEETDEKATESKEVAEEKPADSHDQTEEASDKEETNTKVPQATTTQLAPVVESAAEPVREEQSAEAPTPTLSQIDQLPEEFLTYLRDHSDIVDFKNAATIETYANLLQQSYGVEAAKEERIRAIEAAVKEIETTKEQAKNDVVDQTERLIDVDKDSTTPQDQSKETFKKAIQQADNPQTVVESYLKDAGYKAEDIAGILANVDMSLANDPDQLLDNIVQAGVKYANENRKANLLNVSDRNINQRVKIKAAQIFSGNQITPLDAGEDSYIRFEAQISIEGRVREGDYFEIRYDEILTPDGLDLNSHNEYPPIRSANGDILARPNPNPEEKVVRYTFTPQANNRTINQADIIVKHAINRSTVTRSGQHTVDYYVGDPTREENHFSKEIEVVYPDVMADISHNVAGNINFSYSYEFVRDNGEYRQVFYANPKKSRQNNMSITLFSDGREISRGQGSRPTVSQLNRENSNVRIYEVLDTTKLNPSMMNDYTNSRVFKDVSNQFPNRNTFSNNTTRLGFGNTNKAYVVVVDSKTRKNEQGQLVDNTGKVYTAEEGSAPMVSGARFTYVNDGLGVNAANFISRNTVNAGAVSESSLYEMTVEDIAYPIEYQHDPTVAPGQIVVRENERGQSGRQRILYRHIDPNEVPDFNPDNFVNMRGSYWEEVSRETIQEAKPQIVRYNFVSIVSSTQNDDGGVTITYSNGQEVTIPGPKKPDEPQKPLRPIITKEEAEDGSGTTVKIEMYNPNTDQIESKQEIFIENGKQGEPGTPGRDGDPGKDGRTPSVHTERNEDTGETIITFYYDTNNDGTYTKDQDELIRTEKVKDGKEGEPGAPGRDGNPGEDGRTPSVHTERNEEAGETTITFYYDTNNDGTYTKDQDELIKTEKVKDGKEGEPGAPGRDGNPGEDGRTPSVHTERNEEAGETTITFYYDTNNDGTYTKDQDELIRTEKVKDGKEGEPGAPGRDGNPGEDGRTPSVHTERNEDTGETTITFYYDTNNDGTYTKDQDELIKTEKVKDGKNATGTETVAEAGHEDPENSKSAHGVWVTVYKTDADGNRLKNDDNNDIELSREFIRDGKDGKTPTVETEDIIVDDEIVGTKIIVKDGDGQTVSEREIYDGIDGIDGEDGKDGLSPKVTIEENVTDEEGNPGTRIIITPQYRDENGEIRNGHPEESFIKDGKDGKTPTVETEDIIVDDEIVGTKVIVKDGDGEIVSEREIYDGIDGIDGEDGKDGLSPKVTIEENVTDEEGNPGTRIIITPQYRDENGEIRNGHPEESFIKDGKDGKTPTVETEDIIVDDEIVGTKVIVKDGDGEIVSEREIYDGIDGIDGEDGKDGLSPKVTIEENVTDEEGNPGTRIIITPQYRDENGEIRNGHPEESFIKDGKDGKTPTVETEDIIVDDEIVGTKVIVKDGDGEIVSEREIYDGIDGIDGEDGKDGLSPKVTIEENVTDEEGNPGTRIIITPQYRDENGEIRNGHPEESFIKDGKDGKTPTVETEDIIVDDEIVGTKVIVKDGDGEIVSEREIYDGIDGIDGEDGKDGLSPKVTIEENVTDEEGNPGTRIIITPQYRDENGEIRNGHPEESFIKDGKDGKTPTVETEDIIVDDEIVGTKVIVKDGDGEIVSEREIYDGIDGIDGEDGKDGLSPKVTIEENVTDEEGNPGTRIIITPQYRDENGEIRNGHPEESFIKDGKDGKTPTVETEDIIVDDEIVGTKVIVKDGDGEIVSEREIYDGIDGIDGEDGKDGLSPKVTIEENVTDEEGNQGTRIIITPQYRDENGEIRNGHPEESFIKDGKDGKTPTVETEDIIVDDEIVGTKVIVKDGDGEIVSEREIYDGIDGIDGEDGKDGLSPKVTIEENVTDEEGNQGTRIIITPQYRDENGEIRNGHPEESFIKDGKDGKTPTVETEDIIVDDEIVGTKVIVKDGDGEIVSEREIYDGIDGIDGEDGKDGLSPKVTIEENVTDEEGNPGTRIIITPQYRDENGEIRNGHPEESFIKDGKDGKTPTVETEDIIVDDEIVGTKVIVKDGDGEIVSEREIYDGIDGIDGEDGKDGLSPKVTIEENVTDEEGNPGTRIIITPQYRDENGEIRNGHPEESFIKDGKDGKTPTVETEDIIVDDEIVGTKVIVKDGDGEIVSEREIYDGIDGIDGEDGKDGLSPKVTIEENVTDEEGNQGTRIIITPQYRDENGEIRNGHPEESFIKDGKDGKTPTVETEDIIVDDEIVGTKVIVKDGDGEIVSEREIYDGIDGIDGEDGKDGLSPKVTIEENVTDEEGNPGTRIIITPQYRDENGEIRNGHPEESFIKDGKDGKTPTVETEDIIVDDEIVGTKVIVKDGDGEIVSEREIYDGIDGIDGEDGKDGLSPKVTIEENVTDEEGNPGTRIIITPQYRDENGEIRNGHPEESFIKDGKDGKTPTVETEDIIVDDEIVGTKVIVKDGDGEIVSEREIYDGIDGIDGEDGKDGLSPKVTIEENVTDEEGNPGTRIIITPQYRDENGEIRNGHPEESFIKDGKDGKTPTVETEDIIVDDEIVGTKVIVKDGDGEIVSEREIYDGIDGIDGEDGKDGLSPKVTIEENVTDEEGNPGTRIIITPQYRDENGEIRNGHPEESFIKDGKDGKTPTVETEDIIVDDEIVGTKVIVKDGDGEIVSEREIYDGIDGIDGEDGKDGLSPKVTIEENVTDEEGNPGTRIIITPQYRDENGEIRNGHPEESFIKDGKDGKTPTVETEDIIVDDEIVGTKVIVKDGDGEIVSEREIYDGIDGIDGEDGKDGLSPKVTIEENVTDEEGNQGTRIIITPQYRDENGEIRNGHPEESFIKDGKDGKTPTVETEDIIVDDEIVGTKVIVKDGDGEIVSEREIYDGIDGIDGEDGKDGLSPKVTIEENVTDEEGNPGTRIIITPQYRDENGEIRNGHPEESFIKDGKDGKTPTVETEDIIVDDEIVGTKVIVKDGDGEIVSEREIYDGIDGIDGEDGKDGLSPKVTIEENVTDEEGNQGTRIIITPQYRDENGEIRNGHPEESFIKDGKDGKTPTVETEDIIVDDEIVGTKVIVKDGDGEIVSEREIYDGIDGIDGEDGKDGLSPKVTIEENVTDEEGNPGTRIIITPQYRDENGEIRNGHPEESFIKDGKDGKTPTVETEDIIVDDEIVGTKVIVKDGDGEIVSEREIYDGIDGIDGEDGKDGLSPKVTIEENVTDEEGNPGTRIIITPQYRDENGEIRNGHPEESFIKDGKDGKTPTVETEDIIVDDEIVGTKVIVKDGDGEIVSEREIYDGIDGIDGEDGKDGLSPKVTIEENVTDEEGNQGTRIIITPQYRDENGEIRNGHPEESFIKDGKDGKTPTVETEDIIVDDEIVGTKVIVKDGDGEIVSEREIYDGIDGIDGEDGKDGLSPKVTIEENVTDEEGNPGTRIIITPQYRDENGEIRNGHPEESFIKDGKDGKTPTVETEDIIVDDEIVGTKVIVKDGDGEIVSEREIYDGIDGIDGEDGKDGLSPKVTIEENVTDEEGNPGTRIIITPQYRDENGEIRNGHPEESFIKDGKDGKTPTVETEDIIVDDEIVGTKVIVKDGDGEIVSEREIYDGIDGIDGEDGKDGLSPKVTIEENVTDEEGNPGTRIIITPQYRDENGEIRNGHPEESFVKDGEDGKSITVERTETDRDGNTVVYFSDGSKVTIAKGDKGDRGEKGEPGKDGKDGNSVTASVERGEQNGRPGTYVIIRNEDGTEIDREFIFDGENGQTPTIESSNVLDANGQIVGTRIIIRDGDGHVVGDQIIRNGKDGKDGQNGKDGETPTIGSNGNWFIAGKDTGVKAKGEDGQSITITKETRDADGNTIVHFSDGSTVTISKGDKGDQGQKGDKGERGQTPNVSQTPIRDQNGRIVGYTLTFTDPVTGEKIGNSIDVYNGTDGKDGKSVTASVERGEQNGRPGSYIIIRNEDGVELDREFVFDGEDGTTPKVSVQTIERNDGRKTHIVAITNPKTGETQTFTVTDGEKGQPGQAGKDGRDGRDGRDGKDGFTPTIGSNGNWFIAGQDTGVKAKGEDGQSITVTKEVKDEQGNTVVHFSDGSTITISKGDKGEAGPAGKDGRDGRDGKDGKDLTGNNGNINIENSNNQSQDQNQTQNQNINQVVTNNTYNFGDVSLIINQTLNLNGEVVLTKVIVKDKDGLTNETQIDKNTQINQLNVFVNNGQVLVGTFNLTNQNNVKQLLVGNLIINLVINNDSADNPTVPKKPEQPETTPERPSETPDNTPEQPNETPEVPSTPEGTPGQPGETPEAPGTSETPDNTPEQPNETPNVPSTPEETPGQPGETPETPGTNETPGNTPEQPNETPNVPSTPEETPGQPGETPETPGTNETPGNTPEQPNETPNVPSTPEETPGQPGETPEVPGTNETPGNTPEQPNETPDVPSTPEGTPGQPGETPEAPGTNETPNTPTQLSNTPAQPDRSSITGEQLPETATDSWMLALASLVSLSSGAVLAVKKKKDDE
ncbi:YSIRK-type signal peptide-containing protein [Dolosigranulum pigrum]|uniref:Ig-like domain-containing protein n=1 Tax=Dolosigranulum pigrum TaxID=29394 RepID=UPI001AD87622|nr:Ig-like domain-containing protein [Dolosigranulum pigrum]QTJ51893.1 YSIRK-type signal peptide-containing protein [Dolosigranulum pigrum]